MSVESANEPIAVVPPAPRQRLDVVDLLRGLAIVLMALDHVREFLQAEQINPTNLAETNVPLFFTRWVTHFCAPVFVLLAGAGASLGMLQRKSRWTHARFLLIRGLWLVILELTVVHVGWFFNFQLNAALGQVIWAIGWSMVGLALMLCLPDWLIPLVGAAILLNHNSFDGIPSSYFGSWGWIWTILKASGPVSWGRFSIYIAYPILPWLSVIAVGYGFGNLLKLPLPLRSRLIAGIGITMILLFIALRSRNVQGDPNPWADQSSTALTVLSYLNCQKYPPSLSFLLMTLGPVLAAWPLLERWQGRTADFIITFGRVPLFFYLVHLFVVHAMTVGIVYLQVKSLPAWLWNFPPGHAGPGTGVTLPWLFLIWLGVVLAHYPLCRFYGSVKARYPNSLLRFL